MKQNEVVALYSSTTREFPAALATMEEFVGNNWQQWESTVTVEQLFCYKLVSSCN